MRGTAVADSTEHLKTVHFIPLYTLFSAVLGTVITRKENWSLFQANCLFKKVVCLLKLYKYRTVIREVFVKAASQIERTAVTSSKQQQQAVLINC